MGDWKTSLAAIEGATRREDDKLEPMDRFILAMARWQMEVKDAARTLFNQADAEMAKKQSPDDELLRLRAEAAALLGRTGATTPGGKETNHPK